MTASAHISWAPPILFLIGTAIGVIGPSAASSGTGDTGQRLRVYGWGQNDVGQLGLGHLDWVPTPQVLEVFEPKEIQHVATGGPSSVPDEPGAQAAACTFSLVLTTDGRVFATGCNSRGQLGVGDTTDRLSLALVQLPSAKPVVEICAGEAFAAAVDANGMVFTWGEGGAGQLGLGDLGSRQLPTAVSDGLMGHAGWRIACGDEHVLLLSREKALLAWGSNLHKQLGVPSLSMSSSPVLLQGIVAGLKWQAVAAGSVHSLAISRGGEVYSWGDNRWGQLGLGDTNPRSSPTAVLDKFLRSRISAVAAGARHTLALSSTGEIFSWGCNTAGQLGQLGRETREQLNYPRKLTNLRGAAITAGGDSSGAFSTAGRLFLWGSNRAGQLGTNQAAAQQLTAVPAGIGAGETVERLALGGSHTLAVSDRGHLWGWGANRRGELGMGYTASDRAPSAPVLVESANSSALTLLATGGGALAGGGHSMAVTARGHVFSWGSNSHGQLGLGSFSVAEQSPVRNMKLRADGSELRHLALGHAHSAAVTGSAADETGVQLWGSNEHGQLGFRDQHGLVSSLPQLPSQLQAKQLQQLALGYSHSLGLDAAGRVLAWGSNEYGQLGLGDVHDRVRPGTVHSFAGHSVVQIAAGLHTSFALTESGAVYAWGFNSGFELGLGAPDHRSSPQHVAGLPPNIAFIASGAFHALAITASGQLWTFGDNSFGQLCLGHSHIVKTPQQVPGIPSIRVPGPGSGAAWSRTGPAAAGTWHSMFVDVDGGLWRCGRNHHGQLGLQEHEVEAAQQLQRHGHIRETPGGWPGTPGEATPVMRPLKSAALSRVKTVAVAAAGHHSFAVTTAS